MTHPTPHPLGTESRHYWLALKMAKTTGADLQTALDAHVISHEDWAGMVQKCRGCDWVGGCTCWMESQTAGDGTVPQACPNAAAFERVLASAE